MVALLVVLSWGLVGISVALLFPLWAEEHGEPYDEFILWYRTRSPEWQMAMAMMAVVAWPVLLAIRVGARDKRKDAP